MAIQPNFNSWVVHNVGIQAANTSGYTMLCWMRNTPGSAAVGVTWGGSPGTFSWLACYPANGSFPDGYQFHDVDNAGNSAGQALFQPHGPWVPMLISKASENVVPGSQLYVAGNLAPAGTFGSNLGAQTLTDLYLGSSYDQINGLLAGTEALAEVAIWSGPLGEQEAAQLLSGACPLTVQPGRLRAYFPLRDSLRDFGPSSLRAIGPAPVYTDHPPVEDYRNVLAGLQDAAPFASVSPVLGNLTATTGVAALSATGGPVVRGSLIATTGAATLAATAFNGSITGTLNLTTGAATLNASGGAGVVGSLVATTGSAALTAYGIVGNALPTEPTSVITIGAINEQSAGTTFEVQGTYTLYPTLLYGDDGGTPTTPIPLSSLTPYGVSTFAFQHPAETTGQHSITIVDTLTADSATVVYEVDQAGNIVVPFPPSGPPLAAIIPAYPYEQYRDDENINSFFDAYNALAQPYLDWFNSINLPIYTGLSGTLLDWVAEGLYGIGRPTIAIVKTSGFGAFNTYTLNSIQFNASVTTGTATVFPATDDIFKRIITWNFYKNDGKIFTVKWLKRRIMRFLAGINGTDYDGPTYQVSVTFPAPNALNITLTNGPVDLSAAQVFQVALLGGTLPLPFRYAATVTIPA